jgi:hypothetical protein
VIWEVTSALVIVSMAPLIGMAVRRWPPTRDNLIRPLLIHLGLTIPFAMGHVAAIYVMRTAIYAVVGGEYGYFDDGLGLVLLYEWRKDVLTYATIAAVYWMFDYIAARRQAAAIPTSGDQRIEIRDGGAAVFLAPAEITHVEAAGNYVEFHTPARTHLVRGTLASWEAQLTARSSLRHLVTSRSRWIRAQRSLAAADTGTRWRSRKRVCAEGQSTALWPDCYPSISSRIVLRAIQKSAAAMRPTKAEVSSA